MFTRWVLLPPSSLGDEGASVWTPLILCPARQPRSRAGRDMSGRKPTVPGLRQRAAPHPLTSHRPT